MIKPNETGVRAEPWYRYFWPWLLISIPALAVVAGGITLWLAVTSNNALVVDDYYREGRAINRVIARDQEAARLGLSARIDDSSEGLRLELQATDPAPEFPATLRLRLVHATDAGRDRDVTLRALGQGRYLGAGEHLPGASRWAVIIEEPGLRWRLMTGTEVLAAPIEIKGGTK